jgi:L-lactate dehydrogenase (cytochrome)
VVDAVGGDVEILFDGGVRSGQDVLRALALGARACMIGRAAAYGVGAAGEPGWPRLSASFVSSSTYRWR